MDIGPCYDVFDNAYFVSNPQIHQHSWDIFGTLDKPFSLALEIPSESFPRLDHDRAARFKPILMAFSSSAFLLLVPN